MKITKILGNDTRLARRDMLMLYIIIIPIVIAFVMRLLAPGISDTSFRYAMMEDEDPALISWMEDIAKVELFETREELEERVLKRDYVVGLVVEDGKPTIVSEGNEDSTTLEAAKEVLAIYGLGATHENTTATVYSMQKTVPSTRTMLANILVQLVIMLGGMIISLGVVDEKTENTISAIRVAPVRLSSFVAGKCMLGAIVALLSITISLLIMGYTDINWGMIMMLAISTMVLSVLVGLVQGIISNDIIEAAGGVKLMMLPMIAAMLVKELASERWQWTMWWNPFWWSFKASARVLDGSALWGETIFSSSMVLLISLLMTKLLWPLVDKGFRKN